MNAHPRLQPAPDRVTDEARLLSRDQIDAILAFDAPYLIEKLRKEHILASDDEARRLFTELKRYLILCHVDHTRAWQMHSLRIDEVWHQFVLFTAEYIAFSRRFFGWYLQHAPSNAPPRAEPSPPVATFEELAAAYQDLFGEPLPAIWLDYTSVVPDRRLVNHHVGALDVVVEGGRAELRFLGVDGPVVLLRLDALASDALRFLAATGTFFVRELPGLAEAERVELCIPLVRLGVLRVGP